MSKHSKKNFTAMSRIFLNTKNKYSARRFKNGFCKQILTKNLISYLGISLVSTLINPDYMGVDNNKDI